VGGTEPFKNSRKRETAIGGEKKRAKAAAEDRLTFSYPGEREQGSSCQEREIVGVKTGERH